MEEFSSPIEREGREVFFTSRAIGWGKILAASCFFITPTWKTPPPSAVSLQKSNRMSFITWQVRATWG